MSNHVVFPKPNQVVYWTVSYQTTNMKIFQWIDEICTTNHKAAMTVANDLLQYHQTETIINVRIRRTVQ